MAALQYTDDYSFNKLLRDLRILHFAPEPIISLKIKKEAAHYATADFFRTDCDYKLDMTNMQEIDNESFDIVIAFDVLEHVQNYQKALKEVYRILSPGGYGIFTVPQKDNLAVTYENQNVKTPEDRKKFFGQSDHLRIFGDDFPKNIENEDFKVNVINEINFTSEIVKKHVLYPSVLSKHPLVTNHRKVFICQKV